MKKVCLCVRYKPAQNFLKGSPKLPGEESIHKRVDGGVTVTQPENIQQIKLNKMNEILDQKNTENKSSGTQSVQTALKYPPSLFIEAEIICSAPGYIDGEEGKPTDDKTANNDASGFCCLGFHPELSNLERVLTEQPICQKNSCKPDSGYFF